VLDTDPTEGSADSAGPADTPTQHDTPAKAPRRRRATKAASTPVDADDAAAEPAASDEPAVPKKAPRKRAPRKATAATPTDEAVAEELADAEPVVDAVEDDPVVAEAAVDDVTTDAVTPAADDDTAAPRRRSRRAPAVVPFQAPETTADDGESDEVAAPSRRRRRAGTEGAVSPSELLPTLIAPEPLVETGDDEEADALSGDEGEGEDRPRRRRRGRRGRGSRRTEGEDESAEAADDERADAEADTDGEADDDDTDDDGATSGTRRRRRRRRSGAGDDGDDDTDVVTRSPRQGRVSRARHSAGAADEDGVRGISGSTRMAAKRVRRQEGRDSGRRRQPILSEAEFLARRESVDRVMVVRQKGDRTQIAVLEDGVLVEHYVTRASAQSFAGNVYLGKVQNVLPSMEAAFVDIGKGRNAVLYAGEVNWAALGAGNGHRKIESALKSGQDVLVQVTKDPLGHKGARLTGHVSLPGRYLVYVPDGSMTGISRKLPEMERERLKAILKKVVPEDAGVIIRTAAEGASEEEISADVRRLKAQWEVIRTKSEKGGGPVMLHAEPDLVIRVVRDIFNEDFSRLVVQGDSEWDTIRDYVEFVAPDLAPRLSRHTSDKDVFVEHRIDEQLAKALDRKVWLPSGGSLVVDRTEAMVVIDVNTGKYVGQGGNLEETVTRNNLEAAEEIARQLRLRDIGGIIVVDFIDMVLESNRDLVVRRLVECLGRDRTKHQVAEVTSLGLVQMTRKRVGQGLLESFSEPCERCNGRGVLVSSEPVDEKRSGGGDGERHRDRDRDRDRERDRGRGRGKSEKPEKPEKADDDVSPAPARRRRGGRGAGAATVPPADEVAELLDEQPPAPGVDEVAAAGPPEAAEQPTESQEDLPVLPPEVGSVTDVEPAEDAATAARVEAEPEAPPAPRRRRRATSRPAGPPMPS
jgi:ribonuclease E